MDVKTVVIAVGLIVLLWLGGVFPTASASTSTGQPQPVMSIGECYNTASGIVSPAWAGLNKLQRSVLFFEIANTCEGK